MKKRILSSLALCLLFTFVFSYPSQEKVCVPFGICKKCYYITGGENGEPSVRSPDFMECPF